MQEFIVPLGAAASTEADRVGPKAANLAALARASLPTPGGFCLTADAYRRQCAELELEPLLSRFGAATPPEARRLSVEIRLRLYQQPIAAPILAPLLAAWRGQREDSALGVVRSSALVEDRAGANFAGQFESFLGLDNEADMLTAVRACWAALWTTNARRYMENNGLDPAETAMAVLLQPLVAAKASGGGLSETAEGQMLLSATWGLGSAIAQGEVVPDRISLSRQGFLRHIQPGRKHHRDTCGHGRTAAPEPVPQDLVSKPCLDAAQAVTLGRLMRKAEDVLGHAVEIEWALDEAGFKLLQARPLHVAPVHVPGEILVTKVAGPALSHILPRVGGVVAELGGSTSHLASLARERGIPMVLGVLDATTRIPDGAQVAVDGVAGIVRWIR